MKKRFLEVRTEAQGRWLDLKFCPIKMLAVRCVVYVYFFCLGGFVDYLFFLKPNQATTGQHSTFCA